MLAETALGVYCPDPEFAGGYSNLGNALNQLGKFEEAEEAAKMAIKLTDAPMYNNLGALYDELGRHSEALQYFQKAFDVGPNYASAESC